MNMTPVQYLRLLLGEEIPVGSSETDTMFSDNQISDFLELGSNSTQAGAFYGWQAKMANYANLVSINEGNASRELTELHRNAKRMVDQFTGYVSAPSRGRTRIGNISRRTDNRVV